ncbi:MAG: glycosyltransferase, partial [Bacteroidales bacterium]|nr:glycosyltransferase [Bacteroidales bacterium]
MSPTTPPIMHARIRQFVILFTVAVSLYYLSYRISYTLNLTTPFSAFVSIALICAEAYGIVSVVLFALQVWDPREPEQMPVLPGRTVDVFVPTYNEDPAILRATLEACTRLDYPGVRVYLCDDGGTEQRTADPEKGAPARERAAVLKAICAELGVHYRTRPKNVHAKAGNLNYAFAETDGEFIIIFDADHAPEPHFVSRLIGYFADEKLGYIQTPHAFYNFDSFQSKLNHKDRQYWEEGALFYGVIQPGRNRWNCPIFAGSAAMFRRKALEEVGYIALETITEDMHTGMRMNAKGWKSLGISERMIIGQAAPDITTFHVQRLRWGEGNLSIIFYDNPLTMKGLTLAQRFCYLGSMIHWAGGVFKLIIYLIPILMMLTGVSPVLEFTWTLFTITLIYILVSLFGVKYASNGYGSIIYGELFAMVNYWTQIRGTMRAIFWRKFQQFIVTSKRGRQSNSIWPFIRPQAAIFALSFLALTWGWGRLLIGISDDFFKPMIPSVWLVFHMTLAAMAIRRAMTPESGRYSFRHALNVVVKYGPLPGENGPSGIGVTADLNETGVGFVAYQEIPLGTRLVFEIAGANERVQATGTVVWCRAAGTDREYGTSAYRIGAKFDPLGGQAFDVVSRMTLQYGVPRLYLEYAAGNRQGFLMRTAAGAYRRFRRFRVHPTRSYRLPVHLTLPDGRTVDTVSEELTPTRLAVLLPMPVQTGEELDFQLTTPVGPIQGRACIDKVRRERIGAREYTWVGTHFLHLVGDGTNEVQELVSQRAARGLEAALRPEPIPMPVPMRKPALIVVGVAIALMGVQALTYPIIYSNEIFLRDIARSDHPLTDAERQRFEEIYHDTVTREYPSTDRLVLLMSCLPKINPPDDGDAITIMLAKRNHDNLDLQKAWADVLLRQQDYAGAEARYQQLLARQDSGELTTAEYRELLLAAARSAVYA